MIKSRAQLQAEALRAIREVAKPAPRKAVEAQPEKKKRKGSK